MTFIKTVPPGQADARLAALYDRVKGPDGRVDNILVAHSLRPASLQGHLALYKNVLHHASNRVPKWLLETIGVHVSLLNDCGYCVDHHFAGLSRLLDDQARAAQIRADLEAARERGTIGGSALGPKERAALDHAARLTLTPSAIEARDIDALRTAGWDDGEILEINQVTSYFAYANRTVLGLGVTTDGDLLGLSPGNDTDENDWGHR